MIFGIGCDLCKVSRFSPYWEKKSGFIERFFNEKEIRICKTENQFVSYYASRFAAKEAFVKALGTGFSNFSLKDIYVINNQQGKPEIIIENKVKILLEEKCPSATIHLSITHEDEYAQAFVVIEE